MPVSDEAVGSRLRSGSSVRVEEDRVLLAAGCLKVGRQVLDDVERCSRTVESVNSLGLLGRTRVTLRTVPITFNSSMAFDREAVFGRCGIQPRVVFQNGTAIYFPRELVSQITG